MTVYWGEAQAHSFENLKILISSAPVLAMSDFDKPFQIQNDALTIGIRVVLAQEEKWIVFFS